MPLEARPCSSSRPFPGGVGQQLVQLLLYPSFTCTFPLLLCTCIPPLYIYIYICIYVSMCLDMYECIYGCIYKCVIYVCVLLFHGVTVCPIFRTSRITGCRILGKAEYLNPGGTQPTLLLAHTRAFLY
jgi:hypothetical protein